jgi:GDPmannose 4,6-dehydratase
MSEFDKVWLITGATGQDASYLFELLINKGYKNLHGIIRRSSSFNTGRINHIFDKLQLHYGDLTDSISLFNIISNVKPDYIVNTAAQSHVKVSAELENYTLQTNTIGVLNILQSVRNLHLNTRIYQCSTSEEFGNETDGTTLLDETSPKNPVSIYGVSKLAAENICNIYRDAYNMYIVCGTLMNHESPRRGPTFVTQKIVNYIGQYKEKNGNIAPLSIGNLNSKRDWGHAKDYVEAIYLMMIQNKPRNFVIATGECHSVREFIELAFKEIDIIIKWVGKNENEIGINKKTNKLLVKVDKKYFRDYELDVLIGNSSQAYQQLGWSPKYSFNEIVKDMVQHVL